MHAHHDHFLTPEELVLASRLMRLTIAALEGRKFTGIAFRPDHDRLAYMIVNMITVGETAEKTMLFELVAQYAGTEERVRCRLDEALIGLDRD